MRLYVCECTHPPEVFAVGIFGDAVSRVDLAHQGTEAGSFRDVLTAAHADHLHKDTNRLDKRSKRSLKWIVGDVVCV